MQNTDITAYLVFVVEFKHLSKFLFLFKSNLAIPKDEYPDYVLGKYGRMRAKYLKESKKVEYSLMLIDGTLRKHLVETDMQCKEKIDTLINELKQQENISEDLKNTNPLAWVGAMNNIKNRAEEIIFQELIFI